MCGPMGLPENEKRPTVALARRRSLSRARRQSGRKAGLRERMRWIVTSWARPKQHWETAFLRRMLETHSSLALLGPLFSLAAFGSLLVWQVDAAPAEDSDASVGSLHVEVQDAGNRKEVAARCYLTDDSGKPWTPASAFTYDKRQEHHFITQGTFDIAVPPGRYLFRVERGPEYQP